MRAALRRGREVDDPALAPLAVEAAEHRLGGDESFAPPGLQRALATARPSSALVGASDLVLRRVERGRLRRAAEANRALAGPPRYPDEQT